MSILASLEDIEVNIDIDETDEKIEEVDNQEEMLFYHILELEEIIDNCRLTVENVKEFGLTKQLFHFINTEDLDGNTLSKVLNKELPSEENNFDLTLITREEFLLQLEEHKENVIAKVAEAIANYIKTMYAKFQLFISGINGTIKILDKLLMKKDFLDVPILSSKKMAVPSNGPEPANYNEARLYVKLIMKSSTAFLTDVLEKYVEHMKTKDTVEFFKQLQNSDNEKPWMDNLENAIEDFRKLMPFNKVHIGKGTYRVEDPKIIIRPFIIDYGEYDWTIENVEELLKEIHIGLKRFKTTLEKGVLNLRTFERIVKAHSSDNKEALAFILNLPRFCYKTTFIMAKTLKRIADVLIRTYDSCLVK